MVGWQGGRLKRKEADFVNFFSKPSDHNLVVAKKPQAALALHPRYPLYSQYSPKAASAASQMERKVGWPYKTEFVCHRCGNCCRGDGYVEMTSGDIDRAAEYLGMDRHDFIHQYCKKGGDDWYLHDQEDEERSCIFLFQDEKGLFGCRIHRAKPAQCQGFPFNWRPRNAVKYCDGLRALEGLPPAKKKNMD